MNPKKYNNMMKSYKGFKGERTVGCILRRIPDELKKQLTGKQLGMVMDAIDESYHDGQASAGAELIDDNSVYITKLNSIIEIDGVTPKFPQK